MCEAHEWIAAGTAEHPNARACAHCPATQLDPAPEPPLRLPGSSRSTPDDLPGGVRVALMNGESVGAFLVGMKQWKHGLADDMCKELAMEYIRTSFSQDNDLSVSISMGDVEDDGQDG